MSNVSKQRKTTLQRVRNISTQIKEDTPPFKPTAPSNDVNFIIQTSASDWPFLWCYVTSSTCNGAALATLQTFVDNSSNFFLNYDVILSRFVFSPTGQNIHELPLAVSVPLLAGIVTMSKSLLPKQLQHHSASLKRVSRRVLR